MRNKLKSVGTGQKFLTVLGLLTITLAGFMVPSGAVGNPQTPLTGVNVVVGGGRKCFLWLGQAWQYFVEQFVVMVEHTWKASGSRSIS